MIIQFVNIEIGWTPEIAKRDRKGNASNERE